MKFSDPTQIVSAVGVNDASIVIDLGSGSGHYALACARHIGNEGRVYAVDIQKDLLAKLSLQSEEEQLFNIETIWADIEKRESIVLRDSMADVVLLCNVLFQAENKQGTLECAIALARPNARIVLVDWTDSHSGMGPDPSLIFDHSAARALIEQCEGVGIERELDAGDHHYGMVLRVNKSDSENKANAN